MKLIVSEAATTEIGQAADWFESQQSGLGEAFHQAVKRTLESLLNAPESYARYEFVTSRRWPNLRRAIEQRFSYVIVFDVRDDDVVIVAVHHSSRRPGFWFKRRLSI